MKQLFTRFLPAAVSCLAIVFASCSDDDSDPVVPDAPTISFTAPGLTIANNALDVAVTKDSTVLINYTVTAPGSIETLVQTVDGVSEAISSASGTSSNRQVILAIPFQDKSFEVKVEVTDQNEQSATATLTVNISKIIPPSKELTAVAEIILGGNNSAAFFGRWDLDIPEGYSGWNLRNSAAYTEFIPHIDIFYTGNSVSNASDETFGGSHPTETGPLWPNGFGSFFAKTTYTKAQFDAMENDLELAELTINSASVHDITPGTVVAFITKNGRRGLLYFDVKVDATDDWDVLHKIQVAD